LLKGCRQSSARRVFDRTFRSLLVEAVTVLDRVTDFKRSAPRRLHHISSLNKSARSLAQSGARISVHMREGSHNAIMGKVIRIASRMRSVAMKGKTPAKIVEKLMSWITLFMTNTTIPTGG